MASKFSAAWALENAKNITKSSEIPKDQTCFTCKGNGKITITMVTYDKNISESKTTMDCIDCQGKGQISDKKNYNLLVGNNVWCRCKKEYHEPSYHANDGHEIFGNDTYLCGNCGMVTQFG